jgi:NAD(P)-dependent dehydrogenase (short-subunit alcohol dehydrogenase family)
MRASSRPPAADAGRHGGDNAAARRKDGRGTAVLGETRERAMQLKGTTALVTGASSGIGRATAVALAHRGAHVLVHYGKNKAGAEETLREVAKVSSGGLFQADLMKREDITALFKDIERTGRMIDVLVNNAGDARPGDIDDDETWEYELHNIFLSAVHVSRAFLAMPSAQLRKIVNVTSVYGTLTGGSAQFLQYSAFKAALASLTTTLNKSTAPNVIVNAVAPGYTETPAWAGAPQEVMEALARTTLIGRFVAADEVAHAVVFIVENDALVGQVITLDGGTSLKVLP